MIKYDILIVGAGLFGATFAYKAKEQGKKCLVIDKRSHIGGNIYCKKIEDINVHQYGAHIFHTSNKEIWDFVNRFVTFNNYINSPIANYKGELFNLPFNMNTFYQLWGTKTPEEARKKIEEQCSKINIKAPQNLEEQAISLVGYDIYEKLIKGYTEKQWGKKAKELPAFIIKRLPVRFIYDNNYFNDTYQGIPIGGYNKLIEGLLDKVEVRTNTNYFSNKDLFNSLAKTIVFTGKIDEFYQYRFGSLEYRSLHFDQEIKQMENFQGNAVVNYTDYETPFTRIIEHKHFEFGKQPITVITREYPKKWDKNNEPYYPINNVKNNKIYSLYSQLAKEEGSIIFGGRLAEYRYCDMHQIIESAIFKFNQYVRL